MSSDMKKHLIIAGGFLVICLIALSVAGAYVYKAGMLEVRVQEGGAGDDILVRVPAVVVLWALTLVPDQVYAEVAQELRLYGPMMRAALVELAESPGFLS